MNYGRCICILYARNRLSESKELVHTPIHLRATTSKQPKSAIPSLRQESIKHIHALAQSSSIGSRISTTASQAITHVYQIIPIVTKYSRRRANSPYHENLGLSIPVRANSVLLTLFYWIVRVGRLGSRRRRGNTVGAGFSTGLAM